MSLLDDNEILMNDSENQLYKHMIHKKIEWNPDEYQSFYNFREWVKTNIYRFSNDIGRIDEECVPGINDMRCQIMELRHEIMQLKTEIMDLNYIISKNM